MIIKFTPRTAQDWADLAVKFPLMAELRVTELATAIAKFAPQGLEGALQRMMTGFHASTTEQDMMKPQDELHSELVQCMTLGMDLLEGMKMNPREVDALLFSLGLPDWSDENLQQAEFTIAETKARHKSASFMTNQAIDAAMKH